MPDIQTEMQKILQAWEQPEVTEQPPKDTAMFTPTTNTSRTTFELVRDDPGLPKKEYIRKLEAMGHKKASTSSLLSQMVRQGMLWEGTSGGLHPNAKEYAPLKPAKTFAKQQGIKIETRTPKTFKVKTSAKKYKTKEVPVPAGITALVEERTTRDEVQHIMDTISLPNAKRLHKALNEYFGSV
jgi:hypothetical protein